MKRWFLLAAFTAAFPIIALACGGDDTGSGPGGPDSGKPIPTTTGTATNTSPTATVTTTPPIDGGPPVDSGADSGPAKRKGCLDRPTGTQRPDKLPCELIPPGLTL